MNSADLTIQQIEQHAKEVEEKRQQKILELQSLLQPDDDGISFLTKKKLASISLHGIAPLEEQIPAGFFGGEIVEFYGVSQTGKTELVMMLILNCIMPSRYKELVFRPEKGRRQALEGNQTRDQMEVLYFDNDGHFTLVRLVALMETRIQEAVFRVLPEEQQRDILDGKMSFSLENMYEYFEGEEGYKQFITECMSYLLVFHCESAFRLWVTIESLIEAKTTATKQVLKQKNEQATTSSLHETTQQLIAEHNATQRNYKLIIIDSVNEWMKHQKSSWDMAYSRLPVLAQQHHISIVATKRPLHKKQGNYQEFMPNAWSKAVQYRLTMNKAKITIKKQKEQSAMETDDREETEVHSGVRTSLHHLKANLFSSTYHSRNQTPQARNHNMIINSEGAQFI